MFGRGSEKVIGVVSPSSENKFSLPYLRKLHQQLVDNKVVTPENQMLVIEVLRIIAEMVVYGDNKSELLFDFFCEKNMLSLFLEIMWAEPDCPNAVHEQILQTLSILISCVRNNTSLYYLLSNNYVNEIIIFPHDFSKDESLRDQFVSFMKSLSLRLNRQTVQFFFIEETAAFPLLSRAIELLHLHDNMARIAAQTTILNIFKVRDERARAYSLQDEVMRKLFVELVRIMNGQYASLLAMCQQYATAVKNAGSENDNSSTAWESLENQLSDTLTIVEDWMFYLQDFFNLKIGVLRRALVHHLMNEFVYPTLLQPILNAEKWFTEPHTAMEALDASPYLARTSNAAELEKTADSIPMTPTKAICRSLMEELKEETDGLEQDVQPSSIASPQMTGVALSSDGATKLPETPHMTAPVVGPSSEKCTTPSSVSPFVIRSQASTLSESPMKWTQRDSHEESDDESDALVVLAAIVSVRYLTQMMRTIHDDMLQRALLIALLHPLSRISRIKTIECMSLCGEAFQSTESPLNVASSNGGKQDNLTEIVQERTDRGAEIDTANRDNGEDAFETRHFKLERKSQVPQERFGNLSKAQASVHVPKLSFHELGQGSDVRFSNQVSVKEISNGSTEFEEDYTLNPYRAAFLFLLHSGHERLTLFVANFLRVSMDGVLKSTTEVDLSEESSSETSRSSEMISSSPEEDVLLDQETDSPRTPYDHLIAKEKSIVADRACTSLQALHSMLVLPCQDNYQGVSVPMGAGLRLAVAPVLAAIAPVDIKRNRSWSNAPKEDKKKDQVGSGSPRPDANFELETLPCYFNAVDPDVMTAHTLDCVRRFSLSHLLRMLSKLIPVVNTGTTWAPLSRGYSFQSTKSSQRSRASSNCSTNGSSGNSGRQWLPLVDLLGEVIGCPTSFPIVVAQDSLHAIHAIARIAYLARSRSISAHNSPKITTRKSLESAGEKIAHALDNDPSGDLMPLADDEKGSLTLNSLCLSPCMGDALRYCIDTVRQAGRLLARALLPRLLSQKGDLLLNILQEELSRLKGRKWSTVASKLCMDARWMLSPAVIAQRTRTMSKDVERSVPISQTEAVRRELQIFILVRSLYHQLARLNMSLDYSAVSSVDDVIIGCIDEGFLGFTDTGLIPPQFAIGSKFDMRGRKFLDCYIIPSKLPLNGANKELTSEESSSLIAASIFGFGFLGSKSPNALEDLPRSSVAPRSPIRTRGGVSSQASSIGISTTSGNGSSGQSGQIVSSLLSSSASGVAPSKDQGGQPSKKGKGKNLGEILFVQSNSILLIVEPDVEHNYRVWLTAPIHQTDVSVSTQNGKKLTLFVRSWEKVPHMDLVTMDLEPPDSTCSPQDAHRLSADLLLPRQQGSLYRLTIGFETEASCSLAAQHIEAKRQKMRANRQSALKGIFDAWACDKIDILEPKETVRTA